MPWLLTPAQARRIRRAGDVLRGLSVKLPVISNGAGLCGQCVALCCRYFAFSIDKPKKKRDFEDLRWYILHEDTIIFVEDGQWYVQVNRKCKALLPDNRCGIYHNRPTICRGYKTDACDWHADAYDYDHVFTEPEQIERFAKEYLAARRKKARQSAARGKSPGPAQTGKRRGTARKAGLPIHLLKTA
jgi:Fe-S-cluster containining protein